MTLHFSAIPSPPNYLTFFMYLIESCAEKMFFITDETFTEITIGFIGLSGPGWHAIPWLEGNASAECYSITLPWLASIMIS